MDETHADDRGTAGDRGDRSEAPERSQDAARDKGGSPADGSASTAIKFLQFNIDHARLASANLFETMRECSIEIALISDPYRPGKKLPKPPPGFQYVAAEIDPAAAMLVAKAPFDLCPLLVTPTVVAVYCQARDHDVTLISVYSPPHKPMEPMLVLIEDAIRASRTRNIIVAGDFNAKHSAWGQQQTDARGSRLIAFAASHGLVVINDPDSIPTYETKYSMSWIDVTLASPSLLVRGHSWCVREDVTHSEHRYVVVTIGEPALTQRKRLTGYARAQMLQAIGRDPRFDRITRAEVRSAQALDLVLAQFYRVIDAHHRRHLRPASRSRWGNPWWTPQLALERKRVNAARRRFQRCKDDALRAILRSRYCEHVRAKAEHVAAKIVTFKNMAGNLKPSHVRLLYRQVVLPAIAYASPIWWPERPDCRLRSRILSVQRSVLLALTGAYKTTRTAALQLLLHAPPVELELRRLNQEFTLFVLRKPIECNGTTYDAANVALPIDRWARHPAQMPQERPVRRLSVQQARAMVRNPGLHIYTDGSHTSLSSGAAYVVFGRGTTIKAVGRYKVQGANSAYCTEIVAFTEALIYLRSSASRQPAFLYTDCLSVLQALVSPHCLDPRIERVRALMAQISASRHIQAFHVPGHRGLFGNEIADHLANRACRLGIVRTVLQSVRDIRARLRQAMMKAWAQDWSEHHTSTQLYRWTPDVHSLPSYYPPNHHLTTLITGHGRFPFYFFRFGLSHESVCPCGGDCSAVDHYFTVCPLTAQLVSQLRYREDLATDDRRRILADARNRALLTRMVALISQHIPDIAR